MALSVDQIKELRQILLTQKQKLEDVYASLKLGDPASDSSRVDDNADIGTEAIESNQLVEYESLERETRIDLDRTIAALERIDKGTYGVTLDGKEIPYDRLKVNPTADTVV